ncbi:hypothetical protein B0J11DRAFT_532827 [Dendryphion nanum]|uniref:Uncharacterized protein n=1 Tax=Dendryphion nanum TaxID=256645 RepID=A0A9P9DKY9_9PLEO|nr:hypothetical protein B0J11DRAFT_532827 [Dendryphion nanum]
MPLPSWNMFGNESGYRKVRKRLLVLLPSVRMLCIMPVGIFPMSNVRLAGITYLRLGLFAPFFRAFGFSDLAWQLAWCSKKMDRQEERTSVEVDAEKVKDDYTGNPDFGKEENREATWKGQVYWA